MFNLYIDQRAISDIQEAVDYYNSKSSSLGKKFENALSKEFKHLESNPFYQVKYENIRSKLVKSYPYLIHYTINSRLKEVYVFAIICTHKNPKTDWL